MGRGGWGTWRLCRALSGRICARDGSAREAERGGAVGRWQAIRWRALPIIGRNVSGLYHRRKIARTLYRAKTGSGKILQRRAEGFPLWFKRCANHGRSGLV